MKIYYLVYLLFLSLTIFSQQITISGRVSERENKIGIPFVSVGILNTPIGTICDERGYFSLLIPSQTYGDSIYFSCVGYNIVKKKINFSENEIDINMISKSILLPEIFVYPVLTAKEIMERAKSKIPDNYFQSTFKQEAMLISNSYVEDKCVGFSQMILDILNQGYDSSYSKSPRYFFSSTDLVNIVQKRESNYFYINNVRGKIQKAIEPDWLTIVKEDILNKGFLNMNNNLFSASIIDTVLFDNSQVYVVKCSPNPALLKKINDTPETFYPIHSGFYDAEFYINAKNYVIHNIKFSTKKYLKYYELNKINKDFLVKWKFVEGHLFYEKYQSKYFPKQIIYIESFSEFKENQERTILKEAQLTYTNLIGTNYSLRDYGKEFGFKMKNNIQIDMLTQRPQRNNKYDSIFWEKYPLKLYLLSKSQKDLEIFGNKNIESQFNETNSN